MSLHLYAESKSHNIGGDHSCLLRRLATTKQGTLDYKKRFILPGTIIRLLFFNYTDHKRYKLWSCQNACDALSYLLVWYYLSYTDNLLVFRWVPIVPHLKRICFYFAMKDIS